MATAITPPEQAELVERQLAPRLPCELHVEPEAGHFWFMNAPPPGAAEPLADREAFLERLALSVSR